ncbi:hypothetical protein Tsubulata_040957, partial [Turnera subulata]
MEVGSELSKTVATFIINQIIITEEGMRYCCVLPERFYAIGFALGNMVEELIKGGRLAEHSAKRLLKHIICCYERLSQYPRNQERPHDLLRIASLGLIGALVQVATYIINRIIITEEGMRYCIDPPRRFYAIRHAMRDMAEELVATFIINRIIITEEGMRYCCAAPERFHAIVRAMGNMVEELVGGG